MIKFSGKILQFGFGAVGKSFFEKIKNEIQYKEDNYIVVTRDQWEFDAYIDLGGLTTNFFVYDVNKDNFKEIFSKLITRGDILVDFADSVGTKDICQWCVQNGVMYLNTGEADWPENWYSILNENLMKRELRNKYEGLIEVPIVLQHGNNPGLVSHFVKCGIEYIVKCQFKSDKKMYNLLKQNKFNEIARILGIKMIHVNDVDLQEINEEYKESNLVNTWCVDSFFFELLSEATQNIGSHEIVDKKEKYKLLDLENGFLEYKEMAVDKNCLTYYPGGVFTGYLVPHEETITIANNLEVFEGGELVYRPSVMFVYSPCKLADEYLINSKVNDYPNVKPNKPQDCEDLDGKSIIRGHICPNTSEIIYKEKIKAGTEYVGVLILGDKFNPVWVGNRVELSYLYKTKKDSYWQTPTITPVAMSALAALCWMIKNKDKGGLYFPDDIDDYKYIVKKAEKYISKTIYKTFDKKKIEKELNINFSNIQSKDFFC